MSATPWSDDITLMSAALPPGSMVGTRTGSQLGDNDLQAGLGWWPEAGLEAGIPASVLSHSVTTR